MALSACVFAVSPAPATSSTLRPSCKILRHSQTTSGGHRRTASCCVCHISAVPQTYPSWPKRLIVPTREPPFSHCQLFQRHRPIADKSEGSLGFYPDNLRRK